MPVSRIKKGVLDNNIEISDTLKEKLLIAIRPHNRYNNDAFKNLLEGTSKNRAFVIELSDILKNLYNIEEYIKYVRIKEQSILKKKHAEFLEMLEKLIYKINDADLYSRLKELHTHLSIDMKILNNVNKMSSATKIAHGDNSIYTYTTSRF
jgi:hypothetical protein